MRRLRIWIDLLLAFFYAFGAVHTLHTGTGATWLGFDLSAPVAFMLFTCAAIVFVILAVMEVDE